MSQPTPPVSGSLRDAALAAYQAQQQEAEQQERAEQTRIHGEAFTALRATLTGPDGEPADMTSLELVHEDYGTPLLVWEEPGVALAVRRDDDGWEVAVVERVDGEWTSRREVRSLAEVGAYLLGEG